jgi:S1-C subfamily serine protease
VQPNTVASRYFRPGDQVMSVNDQPVESVGRLRDMPAAAQWKIVIRRDGQAMTISVRG